MDCKSMTTPMVTNLKKLSETASNSDLVDPTMYKQLIGSLMYLVNTGPNICFVVCSLSQIMVEPRQIHWVAVKHVLRYLRGTIGFGLRYVFGGEVMLHGYTDFDWAGIAMDRKSSSEYYFSLGLAMISQSNQKQTSMALNIVEAEYIAASDTIREVVWLRKLLVGLFDQMLETTVIYCDNQRCVKLLKNLVFHDRSKHIEMRYHFIRDMVPRVLIL